MRREVVLMRQAESDIDAILAWLMKHSLTGAKRWFSALEEAIEWLAEHAESASRAPENEFFDETIQQRIFKTKRGRPYRLLFVLSRTQVRVLHVRGPGQDLVRPA